MPKQIIISKKLLSNLYEKENLTTFQIAEKMQCCQATIWKKLIKYNIKSRLPGVERIDISKEELEELYLNKKLSTWKIEKITKIPRGTVHRKLKEFNIKTRDRADSHIIYFRKDFSGNLLEKAYLIGFRIGDLGVRKIWLNSKTISVASGSTVENQIILIKNLFKDYGKFNIQKTKKGKFNIQVSLNETFDFLLEHTASEWIFKDRDYFFSFLAGFSDAEGSIKIYNNLARYSLGNYNRNLLELIRKSLIKYGINCNKLTTDKRKGQTNSQGYIYRNNYSSLRICSKEELLNLLLELSKYMKHPDKVKDLKMAFNNLNRRQLK